MIQVWRLEPAQGLEPALAGRPCASGDLNQRFWEDPAPAGWYKQGFQERAGLAFPDIFELRQVKGFDLGEIHFA